MATIAAIHSKLTLNTKDFRTGLDRATARVGQFVKKARSATNAVGKYGLAMGAAALIGGAALVSQQLDSIDASAKFADQVGVSTEALAGYRHAANLTGVEQSNLEKGLQRLSRTMGQAAAGEAAAVKGLDALGLSAAELEGKLPEEALGIIADRINEQPNAAAKAAAAYGVFGRQGQDMLNFLALGSDGFAATAAEADAFGLSISRVDAAKVEAANDAITRAKALATGAVQTLAVELSPTIEALAERMVTAGTSGQGMGDRVTAAVEWAAQAVAKLADIVGVLPLGFKGAQLAVVSLSSFAVDSLGGIHQMAVDLFSGLLRQAARVAEVIPGIGQQIAEGLNAAANGVEFVGDFRQELSNELNRTQADLQKQFDDLLIAPTYGEQVTQFFEGVRADAEANAEALHAQADAAAAAGESTAGLFDQLEAEAANAKKVEDALAGLADQIDRFGLSDTEIKLADIAELGATNEQLAEAGRYLKQIEEMGRQGDRAKNFAETLADLEREIATTGLDDRALFSFDLESQGFNREQIDEALAKYDELERRRSELSGVSQRGANSLVTAGSAEAQRLAFAGSRGTPKTDDTQKRQLDTQERMAATMERIERNQTTGATSNEWDLG